MERVLVPQAVSVAAGGRMAGGERERAGATASRACVACVYGLPVRVFIQSKAGGCVNSRLFGGRSGPCAVFVAGAAASGLTGRVRPAKLGAAVHAEARHDGILVASRSGCRTRRYWRTNQGRGTTREGQLSRTRTALDHQARLPLPMSQLGHLSGRQLGAK